MKKHTSLKLLVPAFALGVFLARTGSADGGFNVIVNKANGASALSKSELKRLVTGGTKTWDGGAVVQLGLIPSEGAETSFLASLLDTSAHELLGLIQQQVFKGELKRPVPLRSSGDCVAMAAGNPGAICIAAAGTPVPDGAKVVAVK